MLLEKMSYNFFNYAKMRKILSKISPEKVLEVIEKKRKIKS